MEKAGVGERSQPAGVQGASGASGRWRGGAQRSSPPGPLPAVTARRWGGGVDADAHSRRPPGAPFLPVGRCGAVWADRGQTCSPSSPLSLRSAALPTPLPPNTPRLVRIPTRLTACPLMNGAPGPCRPLARVVAKGWEVENRSYFDADLSVAVGASGCFPPTPGSRGWPWAGSHALDLRRRRAESRGSEG